MKVLHVKSLPFKEVISDLADELNVEVFEDCEVYFLKIPKSKGAGSISGINFPQGIGVIYYSCTFNEDVVIKFDLSEIHPAKFLYCKNGYLRHCFLDNDESHELDEFQSAIVASKGRAGHQIQFKGGVHTEIGSLEIDRKKFISQISCDLKSMNPTMRSLFVDTEAENRFYHGGNYSAKLYDIMTEVGQNYGKGLVRKIYLQAKSLEILTEQISQYSDDKKDSGKQNIIRQVELNKINQVADDMANHLMVNHTVQSLSETVGLNENKLQAGFKLLFGRTVRGYLQHLRMKTARDLLINTDYGISEIVHLIGLSNGGYFSKLFRQDYGMSPSEYRIMFTKFTLKE